VKHVAVLGLFVSFTGWCLMLAVGILHKAGVLSWTLGYNAAVPLAALVDLPVMLLLGALVTALGEAKERG